MYLFFFNYTATTDSYPYCHTLSLHDARPIYRVPALRGQRRREAAAIAGVAMSALAVFAYDAATPYPAALALLPCLGTALVIHAGTGAETRVARLLSPRWLVFLCLISYSLYLWHWPLLAFLRPGYGHLALPSPVALAAVAQSFLLATFPCHFF